MFSKVMLAMDLTEVTPQIMEAFYSVCPASETEVYLLHVVEDAASAEASSKYYKKNYSRLKGLAQDIKNAGYDHVEILWQLNNDVIEGTQTAIEQHDIELLLLGSHGKRLWESTFGGSNIFNAIRTVELPTLVVKDGYVCSDYLQRILLPTDFSRKSLVALKLIRNLREQIGEVIFVHVVENTRGEEELRERMDLAEDMLIELRNEMQNFGVHSRYILVESGTASKEICRIAEEEDCSLIFSGKTGAGPIKGMLMGSTAQNILLNSPRSLWIMPDDDSDE